MSDTRFFALLAEGRIRGRAKPTELRQTICARLSGNPRLGQNSPCPASAEGSDRKKFGKVGRRVSPPHGWRVGGRLISYLIDTVVMLSGALQRNARHEAGLSNISGFMTRLRFLK